MSSSADQHGPLQAGSSTAPRPWPVVAWVLGAAAAAAVLFVAGLVTGLVLGSSGAGTGASPQAGLAPAGPSADGGDGQIDDCVVGTWRTVEHEESFSTEQGTVTIAGLVRTMEIDAEGLQTITYDDASATMTSPGSQGTAVYDGTVVYRASTSDGSMSFELVSTDATMTVTPTEGEPRAEDLQPGTGSVRYTCDDTRLSQEADGYRAVYERAG